MSYLLVCWLCRYIHHSPKSILSIVFQSNSNYHLSLTITYDPPIISRSTRQTIRVIYYLTESSICDKVCNLLITVQSDRGVVDIPIQKGWMFGTMHSMVQLVGDISVSVGWLCCDVIYISYPCWPGQSEDSLWNAHRMSMNRKIYIFP